MPYKNKEDRTEAVRRHREIKKQLEERENIIEEIEREYAGIEKSKRVFIAVMDELGPLLGSMGFKCMDFEKFVKICQNELIVKEDGFYIEGMGKLVDKPYPIVFYAGDVIIVLPTLGKRSDLLSLLHGIYLQACLLGLGDRSPLWPTPYVYTEELEE